MKKYIIAIAAFAIFVCGFAFAAQPTWVGAQVNTNTGAVKPSVLEERIAGLIPMWPYTYSFATSSIPYLPYPYMATSDFAVRLTHGSPGDTLGIHSKGNAGIFIPNSSFFLYHNQIDGSVAYLTADDFSWNGKRVALSNDVASVERRTTALEDATGEYWCKWTRASLSSTNANWIPPFTNWPSRNIVCFVTPGDMTNCVIVLPDNLAPEVDCSLRFVIVKTSSGAMDGGLYTAGATPTQIFGFASGYSYREWLLTWRANIGQWFCESRTQANRPYAVDGESMISVAASDLPDDEFLPPKDVR